MVLQGDPRPSPPPASFLSQAERQALFEKYEHELYERERSNAEAFDNAILTYSAAGLGISLAFLKDLVPITSAKWPWLLYVSWVLFSAAIIATVLSYLVSQRGLAALHPAGDAYYNGDDKLALERTEKRFARIMLRFSYGAAATFVSAVVITVLFSSVNLERSSTMVIEQKVLGGNKQELKEGAPMPQAQKVVPDTLEKGMPMPQAQKITQGQPAGAPPKPAPTTQTTTSTNSADKAKGQ